MLSFCELAWDELPLLLLLLLLQLLLLLLLWLFEGDVEELLAPFELTGDTALLLLLLFNPDDDVSKGGVGESGTGTSTGNKIA